MAEILTPDQQEELRRQGLQDEERRQLAKAPGIGAPTANASTPAVSGAPAGATGTTAPTTPTPAISRPTGGPRAIQMPSQYAQNAATAEQDKQRMIREGSGVSQIKNPILKTLARIGDVAGSALFPGVAAAIPGTELHHRGLIAQKTGQVNQGLGEAEKEAETGQKAALAEQERAKAANPEIGKTPDEVTIHDLMTGEAGAPRLNPETQKPYTYLEAYTAVKQAAQDTKPDHAKPTIHETDQGIFLVGEDGKATPLTFNGTPLKPKAKPGNFEEQGYEEWHQAHPNGTRLQFEHDRAAATQKPEREPRQLAVAPDGKVVELKPGMQVPTGTKTAAKYGEASADEQRRADLARNMEENIAAFEDIAKRRPELFGPMAGRVTHGKQWLGSDDPDVAALQTINEQMGMAMVGAHAMRNAQHVQAAANAITNGYKTDPKALLAPNGPIARARASLKTFTGDVERKEGPQGGGGKDHGAAPAGKKDGDTGTLPDGTKVVVKGGRIVAQ